MLSTLDPGAFQDLAEGSLDRNNAMFASRGLMSHAGVAATALIPLLEFDVFEVEQRHRSLQEGEVPVPLQSAEFEGWIFEILGRCIFGKHHDQFHS